MIRIPEIKIPLKYTDRHIKEEISRKLRLPVNQIVDFKIYRKSVDARRKNDVHFSLIVDVSLLNENHILKKNKKLESVIEYQYQYPELLRTSKQRPIVVGFGPAGIFSAYILAEMGLNPIIFERGEDVDQRTISVEKFWTDGVLNEDSNVQFGEGGAGAFSDGKLTTRSKDLRSRKVLEILIKHGASKEILYTNKPHIGTDVLKGIVKSIRNEILDLGGSVYFSTRIDRFIIEDQAIKGVICKNGQSYLTDSVILAIGHSSRDTYKTLFEQKVAMESKPFAMGLRIEHHQEIINKNQYGAEWNNPSLGASDYKLSYKTSNGRSVYSFCVCPGGMVIASSSEKESLVVNGMSEHARDQKNINSGLLVQIYPEDFESDHPLAGVEFQRKYEKKAFILGGSNYTAPVETVGSFLKKEKSEKNLSTKITPSYCPGVKFCDLSQSLPDYVAKSLREGINYFGKKIEGFDDPSAILTGIETRSSAPLRILRNSDSMESIYIKGLYPIGEGAGYAGGIVSSAIDGIKVAEVLVKTTNE